MHYALLAPNIGKPQYRAMIDRRAFLAAAGAGFGAAFLKADPVQITASLRHARDHAAPPLEILTPEQAADIEAIASQIIPTDDLPGAREARVVNFADHSLTSWAANQKDAMLNGLSAWNTAVNRRYESVQRFAQLTPAQQREFVTANEMNGFFQQMIFVTLAGTFSHPDWGGNYNMAGWRILGFENRMAWELPFGWYDARANGGPN